MKNVVKYVIISSVISVAIYVQVVSAMCGSAAVVDVADATRRSVEEREVTHAIRGRLNARDCDGDTRLHKAVKRGDVKEVQRLLDLGADPNLCDAHDRMPLSYACDIDSLGCYGTIEKRQQLMQALYFAGADDPTLTREKLDALWPAIAGGIYYAGILFQENIQDFCELSDEQNPLTELQLSLFPNFAELVKEYLRKPGDMDDYGHPLQERIVRLLGLEDPVAQASHLFAACDSGNMLKVCEALYAGVQVNDWHDRFGQTCLHVAASKNNTEIVRLLLDGGMDIDVKDARGSTCLHDAVYHSRDRKLVSFLLSEGADVNEQGPEGQTSLTLAVLGIGHTYDYKMVQLLLRSGADMDIQDDLGRTPSINAQIFAPRRMKWLLREYRMRREMKRRIKGRCVVS